MFEQYMDFERSLMPLDSPYFSGLYSELIEAVKNGNLDAVQKLVADGAEVNAVA